ncbi:MAG TPA: hypothetical protein DDW94_12880 [Deltaproteobacteria bacterium]|nr:MAG: hypothetical protein A2Z79_06895 [Deltaproteobacteria bacterium GWA2_55_82]OGQ63266.1 MAG: hypothetical protein A3I81_00705 [Deltaproteobacteria bacterium RIFCSPLOWO2_02_FULL_55_12]OIJ73101.1 MAG: hypothetical protein A2V21_301770 [Deltaproteobacteria bacterium GWC2_55_46]HBG47865.1 hypothetical protein [Deltaproteobacteria bacterium]HCY11872.1 hypothetical protein [Deltaproteobacteria bacterium]
MSYDSILSRDSFLLSVELRFFWAIAFAYGISLILHIFHVLTRGAFSGKAAYTVLWAAGVSHAALITFRAFEAGRVPIQTLYESLSWFACSAVLTWLFVSRKWKGVYLPGAIVAALAMSASLYALLERSPAIGPLPPQFRSWWFEWHLMLTLFSYAFFAVSAAIEISWLAIKRSVLYGRAAGYGLTAGMMDGFHDASMKLVLFGFPLLTFGLLSGAAWANAAWGKYWIWDPFEAWSLVTWFVFAIYLHAKAVPTLKGLPASFFNLLGFACMLMTFPGANWLASLLGIPGLHVYAV